MQGPAGHVHWGAARGPGLQVRAGAGRAGWLGTLLYACGGCRVARLHDSEPQLCVAQCHRCGALGLCEYRQVAARLWVVHTTSNLYSSSTTVAASSSAVSA